MTDTFSRRKSKFAQVSNTCAYDDHLSLEAKGLMLIAMALPDDWKFNRTWLQKKAGVGRDKMQKILKQLEENRYLVRSTRLNSKGKMAGCAWHFDDEKMSVEEFEKRKGETVRATDDVDSDECLKSRQPSNAADGISGIIQRHIHTNTNSSKSVNAREENFSVDQSERVKAESAQEFADRVMTELHVLTSGQLTKSKKHYAQLKIQEYQARYPESHSVADCWAYVVQAINHQYKLTGS